MNIHLVNDEKFINQSVERFQKFYPDQNIFFVDTSRKLVKNGLKYVHLIEDKVMAISFLDVNALQKVENIAGGRISNVFVHCLLPTNAKIALDLKKKYSCRLFWIFYGTDLYNWLHRLGKYKLYDEFDFMERIKSVAKYSLKTISQSLKVKGNLLFSKKKFVKQLDYFCFWNKYDYDLLKDNFETQAKFRDFRYFTTSLKGIPPVNQKGMTNLILNQSSSKSGNHLSALRKIKSIDKNKEISILYIPLSYGNPSVKKKTLAYGNKNFSYCFFPLLKFMDKADYFHLLNNIQVGVFTHRRQEAGSNIFYLLALGAKIFLRNSNTIYHYLKDNGYHVYSYEDDLKSQLDLNYIGEKLHEHNRFYCLNEFSEKRMQEIYKGLLD